MAGASAKLAVLTVVLCALWQPALADAYSTRETERGAQVRWAEDTVVMRVDPSFAVVLGERPAAAAMDVAEGLWASVPNGPSILVGGAATLEPGYVMGGENENGIYLLAEWPFDDDRLAVTVSTYNADGTMLDADVLVNGTHLFALVPEGGYVAQSADEIVPFDLASVLTHELGHVLGLGENEDDMNTVMWPNIRRGDTSQRVLSDDDRQGVRAIYGDISTPASMPSGGCVGGSTVARSPRVSFSAPLFMLVVAFAACGLRMRAGRRRMRSRNRAPRASDSHASN